MKFCFSRAVALGSLLFISAESLAGDQPKTSLESFRAAFKDARSTEERAIQIQALGAADPGEPGLVAELARFLIPSPGDQNLLFPVTAAAALGRMRGSRMAALALLQALPFCRRTPYVHRKVIAALGQVGHEAALPALQDLLTGAELDPAVLAVKALGEMPLDVALDGLFRGWEGMQKRKPKVGDDLKKQYDRLGIDILAAVQKLTGERYPSLSEMQLWWSRHGAQTREAAADRERERDKVRQKTLPSLNELPPVTLVELSFNEQNGASTANLGSSSGSFATATLTRSRPAWSHDMPPPGGAGSLDWGSEPGPYAVDLAGPVEHLKNLKSFTITAWINARSGIEGAGGNRIVSWLERDGVEIVHRSDGSLQVGINQKAEASAIRTPSSVVPTADLKAENAIFMNWRFIAVTYDSTAAAGHLKIYSGTRDLDASLILARDCPSSGTGARIAAGLSVGNVPPAQRPLSPKCNFRGLIDEIRILGSCRDGSGALPLPAIVGVQAR